MKKKVLVIDDDADMCMLLNRFLEKNDFAVECATTSFGGIEKFKDQQPDIVLCDYRLEDDKNGKDVLLEIKKINPETIVVIITGYSDIKTAVDVMRLGAMDYITKPLVPDEVLQVVNHAALSYRGKDHSLNSGARKKNVQESNELLIGVANTTKELNKHIEMAASTDFRIIINGESGTGKEIVAKTIHEKSRRKNKPFISLDCNKPLTANELAAQILSANNGILFFEEVSALNLEMQSVILKLIQEKKVKTPGSEKENDVDIRVIVSSIENLQEEVLKGNFLEQLYHKLNEFSIYIPPLRERKEDIPLFADFFLNKTAAEMNKDIDGFDDDIIKMLVNYSWPGNLKEFENTIRRAILLTNSNKISASNLSPQIIDADPHRN